MPIDHLILSGQYTAALKRTGVKDSTRIRHGLSASGVRESITANLCVGRFAAAEYMADGLIARFPRLVAPDYVDAGTARWMQRRFREAAGIWRGGLKCGYTHSRGLDCALLLWYAAVRSRHCTADDAIDLMQSPRLQSLRQGYFVDTLVQFILGQIDEPLARSRVFDADWEHITAYNLARLEFYVAVRRFARGDRRGFKLHMSRSAEATGVRQLFPELILARFECGQLPFQRQSTRHRVRAV